MVCVLHNMWHWQTVSTKSYSTIVLITTMQLAPTKLFRLTAAVTQWVLASWQQSPRAITTSHRFRQDILKLLEKKHLKNVGFRSGDFWFISIVDYKWISISWRRIGTCYGPFPKAGLVVYRFPPYLDAQSTRPCTGCTAGALVRRFPEALPKAE